MSSPSSPPMVSVLMSVHNGREFLARALDSLWAQTFGDFRVVAVDDCSDDGTPDILEAHAGPRLQVLRLTRRHGLGGALNVGLEHCDGKYVARMDADDLAHPERLARQTAFMEDHPGILASGSWTIRFHEEGGEHEWRAPLDHEGIVSEMLFRSPIAHPSSILRREEMERLSLRYDPEFACAQDYDLWWRVCRKGRLANLGEFLLRFRMHGASVSESRRQEQDRFATMVRRRMLAALGVTPSPEQETLHLRIAGLAAMGIGEFRSALSWLETLVEKNADAAVFPPGRFAGVAGGYLRVLGERASEPGACLEALGRSRWFGN